MRPTLRLVQPEELAPENTCLREALDRVTRGSPTCVGLNILDKHEAEALYRVLASCSFTPAQLDAWIDRLRADHPYDRTSRRRSPSRWAIIKWTFFGGVKPWSDDSAESVIDWAKRTEQWIRDQIASLDEPSWLERPLQVLDRSCQEVANETGEPEWHPPVLRWALLQLLTTPAASKLQHATG